jgi:hypothetical protein
MIGEKLPTSANEVRALFVVCVLASVSALFRLLYGRDELSWRYTVASMGMAAVAGMIVYGAAVHVLSEVTGYYAVVIGCSSGVFTESVLRRIGERIDKAPIP